MYKIPNRKKNLLTNKFLQDFNINLLEVFKEELEGINIINYWSFYQAIESTCGFRRAYKLTCEKHNVTKALFNHYQCDDFDSFLTILMYQRNVILEGNSDDYFSQDDQFEMWNNLSDDGDIQWYKFTIHKKGYNLVGYDYYLNFTDSNINEGKIDNETRIPVEYKDVMEYLKRGVN